MSSFTAPATSSTGTRLGDETGLEKETETLKERIWNLRPKPGRYDDAVGLVVEGVKLAERHGARNLRLTSAGLHLLWSLSDLSASSGRYLSSERAGFEVSYISDRGET